MRQRWSKISFIIGMRQVGGDHARPFYSQGAESLSASTDQPSWLFWGGPDSLQVPLSSSGWAGKQTAKHWMCGILRAALGLRLCWGWPGVEAAAGYLWCACRTAAAQESQLAHPWPVVPCSAPGSPIGPHNLGRGQTGTDKKGVLSSGQGSGKHSGFIFDP